MISKSLPNTYLGFEGLIKLVKGTSTAFDDASNPPDERTISSHERVDWEDGNGPRGSRASESLASDAERVDFRPP